MQRTASLYDFTVTWEPFLLRPGIPDEGIEKPLQYKTISKSGHLYQAGQAVGIEFTGKCTKFPNTLVGHMMLEYLKTVDATKSLQNMGMEKIFQAYFTDGIYPTRQLMDVIAQELGVNMTLYSEFMNNPANLRATERKALQWREQVDSGVPFFIINGQPTFSGAQDTSTFIKTFETLAQRKLGHL